MPGTTPLKSSLPTKCSSHLRNASGFGDPLRLQSATGKLHSAVLVGGIAQLVERQLCKLEVRGSNPLASSLRSRRREERRLARRSPGEGGRFSACSISRARYDSASQYDPILLCLHSAERSGSSTVLYRID